jgi:hypothetical protein
MAMAVVRCLEQLGAEAEDAADRRNRHYLRHLLTTLGDIEPRVPGPGATVQPGFCTTLPRREAEIDRFILAGFVLGDRPARVGKALLAVLGRGDLRQQPLCYSPSEPRNCSL